MQKCPKCKQKTLRTREDAVKEVLPEEMDGYFSRSYIRTMDEWSICSEACTNPECDYIK